MKNKEEVVNDKFNAFIKLCLWGIFIVFVVLVSSLSNNKIDDNTDSNNKQITYQDKLNKLSNNYKFKYEIKVNNEIYTFEGSKLTDKEIGTRNYNDNVISYYIENGMSYKIVDDKLKEFDNLYDSINTNNLNIDNIKAELNLNKYLEQDGKYSYILGDNKIVNVYSNEENITKIEIYIGEDYYKLEFSDIGLIKEINY